MKYTLRCPHCGGLSATDNLPFIGQHCLCPFCEHKFDFAVSCVVDPRTEFGAVRLYSSSEISEENSEVVSTSEAVPPLDGEPPAASAASVAEEPSVPVVAVAAAVEPEGEAVSEVVPPLDGEPPAASAASVMDKPECVNNDLFSSFRDCMLITEGDIDWDTSCETSINIIEVTYFCDISGFGDGEDVWGEDLISATQEICSDLVDFTGTIPVEILSS